MGNKKDIVYTNEDVWVLVRDISPSYSNTHWNDLTKFFRGIEFSMWGESFKTYVKKHKGGEIRYYNVGHSENLHGIVYRVPFEELPLFIGHFYFEPFIKWRLAIGK